MSDWRYVFVLGCPRSGTSLLQTILERHPDVIASPETKLFYTYDGMPGYLARKSVRRLEIDMGIPIWSFSPPSSMPDVTTLLAIIAERLSQASNKLSANVFCEKSNEHSIRVHQILRKYPDARFVVLTRDGRAVAASLTTMPWADIRLLAGISVWRRYVRYLAKWMRDDRFLFVRFEDLLDSPHAIVCKICEHIGVPPLREDILRARVGDESSATIFEREIAWKANALKPINREKADDWKKELDIGDIERLERLARCELELMGYPLSMPAASPGIWLRICQVASIVRMVRRLPGRFVAAEVFGYISWLRSTVDGGMKHNDPPGEPNAVKHFSVGDH